MLNSLSFIVGIFFVVHLEAQSTQVRDDFEGGGTIATWIGDDCAINSNFSNPFSQAINTSATVLEYNDVGGQYANVRFELNENFDLSTDNIFTLKIYVPSSGTTGTQTNKVSLKLQNGQLDQPWVTQTEIIKPIILDQWQTVVFDFLNDDYINFEPNSPAPRERGDLNRVVIQVNGENNTDLVLAYIDDFFYNGSIATFPNYNTLVWADEFDTDGELDLSNWFQQTQLPSGGSWFNGEIQHYTSRQDNSFVTDGVLHIVAKKESFTDQGETKAYTSARLNSKFAFQYGRVEVRAKLPQGVGTWPAIWMLGKNIQEAGAYWEQQGYDTTPWPACGEIDIMEHWGTNQNYVQSATHTPSSSGATENFGGQFIASVSSEFHSYTLDWYPEKLVFAVDGTEHYTYEPEVRDANTWPFDADQYILLNFAILPSINSSFTEDALQVDYVRVYQNEETSSIPMNNTKQFNLNVSPNPAKDYTTISYNLSEDTDVKISIYNINGLLIETLVMDKRSAGNHMELWNTSELLSGIYFYQLQAGGTSVTKKIFISLF